MLAFKFTDKVKALLVAGALAVTAGCGGQKEAPIEAAEETSRTIESGDVVGFIADSGAHVWRAIPYAASTAGENRWRAPRPAPSWERAREALEVGERCPQYTISFDRAVGLKPGLFIGDEDCLTLDIYAPPNAKDKNLPVMVWIHGGGNVHGLSGMYDGSNLAVKEDVIIVAVQYRLGPLGWFAHQAIRESAETPRDRAANFGLLDLIYSLEWVRDNVSTFGGDPENVTIFGESAGGFNVATLLASPIADGLFHKAIIQSGLFDSVSLEFAESADETSHESASQKVAEKLNATNADALRAVPTETLFGAYAKSDFFLQTPTIIEDGVSLPAFPMRDAFKSPDSFNAVPIITGVNRDEMKLFFSSDNRWTRTYLGFLVTPRDVEFYNALSDYVSRVWRIRAVDDPAGDMVAGGHEEIYAYRFDWDDGGRFLIMNAKTLFGAAHAMEVPFIFNDFDMFGASSNLLYTNKTKDDREYLAHEMAHYWATFARKGIPTSSDGPVWRPYGEDAALIRFDARSDGGVEMIAGRDSIDRLVADLAGDTRLTDDERCIVVDEIATWQPHPDVVDPVKAAISCE